MNNGSKVHYVALEASKAFDKVLHDGLFNKILSKGVPSAFVKPLIYWYNHIQGAILSNSVLGESFEVFIGVRQGGVLSTYLFLLYINDLIDDVRNSSFGIYIGTVFVGCILCADDIDLHCHCLGVVPGCRKWSLSVLDMDCYETFLLIQPKVIV